MMERQSVTLFKAVARSLTAKTPLLPVCIALFATSLAGCNTKSEVNFKGVREDILLGKTTPYSAQAMSQGGVTSALTPNGYRVSVSLGVQAAQDNTDTRSPAGNELRMNFVGQTSQKPNK